MLTLYEQRYLLSKLLFTPNVSIDYHSRRQQLTGHQQIAQSKERHDLRSVLFKLPTMDGLVSKLSLGNRVRVPYYYIVWKPIMVCLFPCSPTRVAISLGHNYGCARASARRATSW